MKVTKYRNRTKSTLIHKRLLSKNCILNPTTNMVSTMVMEASCEMTESRQLPQVVAANTVFRPERFKIKEANTIKKSGDARLRSTEAAVTLSCLSSTFALVI